LSSRRSRPVRYDYVLAVRIERDLVQWLNLIALFERIKTPELMRRWISSQVLKYQRNPQFKSWLRQYREIKGGKL